MDWTPAEWENLEQLSAKLHRLLSEPLSHRTNRAWQAHLRVTLASLAGYRSDIMGEHNDQTRIS